MPTVLGFKGPLQRELLLDMEASGTVTETAPSPRQQHRGGARLMGGIWRRGGSQCKGGAWHRGLPLPPGPAPG